MPGQTDRRTHWQTDRQTDRKKIKNEIFVFSTLNCTCWYDLFKKIENYKKFLAYRFIYIKMGVKDDWDFQISDLVKTLMELMFNHCGEFRWSPEPNPLSSPPCWGLWIFSDVLRSVQMLKREWCAENNGKLPHLFIPSKSATFIPAFAMEGLPFCRIAALMPEFAVKDLPLSRTLMMMMMMYYS